MTHSALPIGKDDTESFSAFRLLQKSAFVLFAATALAITVEVIQGAVELGRAWLIPLVVLAAYAVADLLSGIVHFLADNFGSPDTPVLGKAFVMPFRDHHTDPTGILHHPFMIANGNNCLIGLPPLLIVLFLADIDGSVPGYLLGAFTLSLSLSVFFTNQFHKWAHMETPPRAAAWLQSKGVILSKQHHDVHHMSPFDTYYCITTGWWNPILQKTGVFDWIVRLARRAGK
jgi:plasmanylethanolamine desaturase